MLTSNRLVQYELRAADNVKVLEPSRSITFVIGEDAVHDALETVVRMMHPGEQARIDVSLRSAATLLRPHAPNVNGLMTAPPLPSLPMPTITATTTTTNNNATATTTQDASLDAPAAVMYVTLNSVESIATGWEMPTSEKLQHAANFKERGNALFAENRYNAAARKYKHALTYVEWTNDWYIDPTQ